MMKSRDEVKAMKSRGMIFVACFVVLFVGSDLGCRREQSTLDGQERLLPSADGGAERVEVQNVRQDRSVFGLNREFEEKVLRDFEKRSLAHGLSERAKADDALAKYAFMKYSYKDGMHVYLADVYRQEAERILVALGDAGDYGMPYLNYYRAEYACRRDRECGLCFGEEKSHECPKEEVVKNAGLQEARRWIRKGLATHDRGFCDVLRQDSFLGAEVSPEAWASCENRTEAFDETSLQGVIENMAASVGVSLKGVNGAEGENVDISRCWNLRSQAMDLYASYLEQNRGEDGDVGERVAVERPYARALQEERACMEAYSNADGGENRISRCETLEASWREFIVGVGDGVGVLTREERAEMGRIIVDCYEKALFEGYFYLRHRAQSEAHCVSVPMRIGAIIFGDAIVGAPSLTPSGEAVQGGIFHYQAVDRGIYSVVVAAEYGDPSAQMALALAYAGDRSRWGIEIERDEARACYWRSRLESNAFCKDVCGVVENRREDCDSYCLQGATKAPELQALSFCVQ